MYNKFKILVVDDKHKAKVENVVKITLTKYLDLANYCQLIGFSGTICDGFIVRGGTK